MLAIRPLNGNHDRKRFECGSAALDLWLRQIAQQHQRQGISKTFVAVTEDAPAHILGYYALTVCEVVAQELPKNIARRLPRKIPGVRLGRLAVDRSMQGQGLGEFLLMDAINRAQRVLDHVGVHALFVDAKDDAAASFYQKYGFQAFPDMPLQLVLVLAGRIQAATK